MTTRRSLIAQLPAAAVAGSFVLRARAVFAADKSVTVGITVPLVEDGVIVAKLPWLRIGAIALPDPLFCGPTLATTLGLETRIRYRTGDPDEGGRDDRGR